MHISLLHKQLNWHSYSEYNKHKTDSLASISNPIKLLIYILKCVYQMPMEFLVRHYSKTRIEFKSKTWHTIILRRIFHISLHSLLQSVLIFLCIHYYNRFYMNIHSYPVIYFYFSGWCVKFDIFCQNFLSKFPKIISQDFFWNAISLPRWFAISQDLGKFPKEW